MSHCLHYSLVYAETQGEHDVAIDFGEEILRCAQDDNTGELRMTTQGQDQEDNIVTVSG